MTQAGFLLGADFLLGMSFRSWDVVILQGFLIVCHTLKAQMSSLTLVTVSASEINCHNGNLV